MVAAAPRGDMADSLRGGIADLAAEAAAAGVRLGAIGGAGALQVAEGGPRLFDGPEFPAEYKPESLTMLAVLEDLQATDGLDWFYVRPPAMFGAFNPGEARGTYSASAARSCSPTRTASPTSAAPTSPRRSSTRSRRGPTSASPSPSPTEPVAAVWRTNCPAVWAQPPLQFSVRRADQEENLTGRRTVGRDRSAAEQQIAELLQTARASLRLSVAFLSRLDGTTQHLEVVESSMPLIFRDGITQKQEDLLLPGDHRRQAAGGHPRREGLPGGHEAADRPHPAHPQLRVGARRPQRRQPVRHVLRLRASPPTRSSPPATRP